MEGESYIYRGTIYRNTYIDRYENFNERGFKT